jgi:hypothetical protein
MEEQEGVFLYRSCEAVSAPLPQEADIVCIAAASLMEKFQPHWAVWCHGGGDGGCLGHVVRLGCGSQRAGFQVDGSAGSSEQPRVGVPYFACDSKSAIGLGQSLDARREGGFSSGHDGSGIFRIGSQGPCLLVGPAVGKFRLLALPSGSVP